jgi:hypothetical protein
MSRSLVRGRIGVGEEELGGRHRHHKEKRYDYRGIVLLVLGIVSNNSRELCGHSLRLLKLVTGVDISTRAVRRSGRPGNPVKSSRRKAAAAPNRAAFLRSIFMVAIIEVSISTFPDSKDCLELHRTVQNCVSTCKF